MRSHLVATLLGVVLAGLMIQACAGAHHGASRSTRPAPAADLRLPEPMVFDLVRPLGAKRGEVEVNTLGLVRMRRHVPLRETPDPLGLLPGDGTLAAVELSPEVEVMLWDGFGVEFEVPFEGTELAALKPALQWTIGTGFGGRYIHGLQLIGQYELDPRIWAPTLVYIGGTRLTPRTSVIGMLGARGEVGEAGAKHAQILVNAAPFVDLNPRAVAGMDVNGAPALMHVAACLVRCEPLRSLPILNTEAANWCVAGTTTRACRRLTGDAVPSPAEDHDNVEATVWAVRRTPAAVHVAPRLARGHRQGRALAFPVRREELGPDGPGGDDRPGAGDQDPQPVGTQPEGGSDANSDPCDDSSGGPDEPRDRGRRGRGFRKRPVEAPGPV